MAQQSKWGSIIALVSMVMICVATLAPGSPPSPNDAATTCVGGCDDSLVADFLRNIVLFMPLGFGVRLAGMRMSRAVLVGSCLSGIVELLQIRIIVGRDASVLDWVSNSAGTVTGALIAKELGVLIRPASLTARRLATAALIVFIGVLTLGAWGVQPAPSDSPYWGERTPMLGNAVFAGELISTRVNGEELPSERMRDDEAVRKPLREGHASMDAVVRAAPVPPNKDLVAIGRIADADQREILLLGRDRGELVFRIRMHATAARLETPTFALGEVFPTGGDGDPEAAVTPPESLTAVLRDGHIRLTAATQEGHRAFDFALTPALAWTFFLPWDYWIGPGAVVFSWAWQALLVVPIAYWGTMSGRDRKARWVLAGIAAATVASLVLVPVLVGLPAPQIASFMAVLAGAAVGAVLGSVVSRRGGRRQEPR